MLKQFKTYLVVVLMFLVVLSNHSVSAQPNRVPELQASVYDLVNAVNALRAAYGLPAYGINSILMFTAQNQADFMAATGNVTHSGAGGSSFTERLLAAGYPLGGDLAAGGFRSENIISGTDAMSAQGAVDAWMGDAPHQNTMLSQNLTEIGAGVAIVDGRVYYVIDCARPSTSGAPVAVGSQVVESGPVVPASEAVIRPVVLSTPDTSGDVIHEVQSGQTLWQIAISYEVKIDDIKRLNNLFDNNIYPGDKLLIKKNVPPATTVAPLETAPPEATATVVPSATLPPTLTATATAMPPAPAVKNNSTLMIGVILILALAIVGGGFFTWLGSARKDKPS